MEWVLVIGEIFWIQDSNRESQLEALNLFHALQYSIARVRVDRAGGRRGVLITCLAPALRSLAVRMLLNSAYLWLSATSNDDICHDVLNSSSHLHAGLACTLSGDLLRETPVASQD